jgi:hypothetical protein
MTTVSAEFDARIDMKAFIERTGAPYSQWYAGVAADPKDRLFSQHGVRESDWWIVRRRANAEAARQVAQFLLKLGCDGGLDDDEASTAVYAYRKQEQTLP